MEETAKLRSEELEQAYEQLNTTNLELFSKHQELKDTILELKQTQNQLIQSEKLASLGVFTAGIAHEINNPLNFISSASEALFDSIEYLIDHPDELKTRLDDILYTKGAIKEGIDRSISIVSSLRNYAHSGGDQFVTYDIKKCINDSLLLLQNNYKYRIKIKTSFPDEMAMECIPGKINQVFVNIISNAIDAIDKEGTIEIYADWHESTARIEVIDDGSGIDNESLVNIFDPFFTTKEVGKGTGLGLYIVHGIITQHQGTINISSTLGKGTSVVIELPKYQSSKSNS